MLGFPVRDISFCPVGAYIVCCVLFLSCLFGVQTSPVKQYVLCGKVQCDSSQEYCQRGTEVCGSCESLCASGRTRGDALAVKTCKDLCSNYIKKNRLFRTQSPSQPTTTVNEVTRDPLNRGTLGRVEIHIITVGVIILLVLTTVGLCKYMRNQNTKREKDVYNRVEYQQLRQDGNLNGDLQMTDRGLPEGNTNPDDPLPSRPFGGQQSLTNETALSATASSPMYTSEVEGNAECLRLSAGTGFHADSTDRDDKHPFTAARQDLLQHSEQTHTKSVPLLG